MKKFFFATILLGLFVVGLAIPQASQAGNAPTGIPGYYNPAIGTFAPLTIKTVPLVAPVNRTGTVNIVITLGVESAIGADEPITCNASISSFDASFSNSASAGGLIVRTGSTGKVTISIPYNWTMAATGEQANISVNCSESGGFSVGSTGHSLTFTVPGFTVPATAKTVTTKTLAASL